MERVMATFHFELVSPERLLFSGDVESVVVPGTEGAFTVLRDHADCMAILKPGLVEIQQSATTSSRVFVRGGFADVSASGLTILAEQSIGLEELDAARLDAQLQNAQEDVDDAPEGEAKRIAHERLSQLKELRQVLDL
jgi:F-type H+-transporting ATPase subunit epsilon